MELCSSTLTMGLVKEKESARRLSYFQTAQPGGRTRMARNEI